MGNFEKLSVLVIVVIIVMILVVALYTWTGDPETTPGKDAGVASMKEQPRTNVAKPGEIVIPQLAAADRTAKGLDRGTQLPATSATSGTSGGTTTSGGTVLSPFPTPTATAPVLTEPPKELAKPAEPKSYEVVSGDNLTKIAKKYYGSKTSSGISLIRAANSLSDEASLRVGQKLTIPELKDDGRSAVIQGGKAPARVVEATPTLKPGTVYIVKSGDTLPRISRRAYGTADKWHEIWLANFNVIEDPEKVSPGTHLKLPM